MAHKNEDYPVLVAQAGPLNGVRWQIKDTLVIGRDESCDVVIPSRQVSRAHVRFSITDKGTLLEDLESKNGTHLNGKAIHDICLLQDGDIVQVALAQEFVYVSSDATLPLDASQSVALKLGKGRLLRLDKRSRRVWVGGTEVQPPLSVSQFSLLELLYDHQGLVVHRKDLIENVWGEEDAVGVSEQALDALVRRLRDRLAAVDPNHSYIITIRGHGLRLDNPHASPGEED